MNAYGFPPAGPSGSPPPRALPARPGPTGPAVAIGSGAVAILSVAVAAVVADRMPSSASAATVWAATLLPYLPILAYLAAVGRGLTGRLAGVGAWTLVALTDTGVALWLALTRGEVHRFIDAIVVLTGVVMTVAGVAGWGLARRDGIAWIASVPVGIGTWALWQYVVGEQVLGAVTQWAPAAMQVGFAVFTWVIPILVGWLIDVLTRGPGATRPTVEPGWG
ncbi:hypothetical protein TTY48_37940 [Tsukamurella sp. TY48]|uniref:hypothetical protein n=1 Tax=Tsukamurella TaxID=2060 RepID=UPI001C7CF3C0|nr:hypothetical protein [Tsukamurella sp. TY48]GIZ99182.1 hypothetical protein TTY48_37940 [Tsukamurella sp. TY48]